MPGSPAFVAAALRSGTPAVPAAVEPAVRLYDGMMGSRAPPTTRPTAAPRPQTKAHQVGALEHQANHGGILGESHVLAGVVPGRGGSQLQQQVSVKVQHTWEHTGAARQRQHRKGQASSCEAVYLPLQQRPRPSY